MKFPSEVIESGDADLLIAPSVFMSSDHPSDELFTDDFVALVWSGSVLGQAPLTLESYLAAKHVVVVSPANAPTFQSDFMAAQGLKIFTDREGGVEHVGCDNMAFGRHYIADWFAETLGGRTR